MLGTEMLRRRPAAATNYGGESTAALRVLRVLRDLQARWCRVAQLVERHKVDAKTIRRDLAVIRRAGFRVRVKVESHGRKAYRCR